MSNTDFLSWDRLVLEGEALYEYMIHNYDKMFDSETSIKHFGINKDSFGLYDCVREIKDKYHTDIQRELIPWIKKEIEDNDLFQNKNWNTFRDHYSILDMFLGYRKMFQYKQYVFQLSIDKYCGYDHRDDICKYCDDEEYNSEEDIARFFLVLYGWKDEKFQNLQPYNDFSISDDNLMPESFWMCEINWIREQQKQVAENLAYEERIRQVKIRRELSHHNLPIILDDNAIPESNWMNEIIWLDK